MNPIIIIAGTSDARFLIERITSRGIAVVATTATGFGAGLLKLVKGVSIREGRMDSAGIVDLISQTGASGLIDASHPYAVEVSANAIEACKTAGIKYLRYERAETIYRGANFIEASSYEDAAQKANAVDGNIFLTTGSKSLEVFIENTCDYKKRLFARVLSDSTVIAKCEALGLTAANIFAARGPFSEEMNVQMLLHCKAAVMVTKNSGEEGGMPEKMLAAKRLGIPVVVIKRPDIDYPNMTGSFVAVVEFAISAAEGG